MNLLSLNNIHYLLHLIHVTVQKYTFWLTFKNLKIQSQACQQIIFMSRDQLKCDDTHAETRLRLSAKRTSPFQSAGDVSSV